MALANSLKITSGNALYWASGACVFSVANELNEE